MTTKSFIKTIGSKGLLADYNTEGKKLQTEDSISQTYSSTSTKAQSGVAVNEAFKTRETSGSGDSYTYLGMLKTGRGTEELYWKLVSFTPIADFWTLQFEIDVSNGRKGNSSFDNQIYETKRLTIVGSKNAVGTANEMRYIAQEGGASRGYGNNIYYEMNSSGVVTVYIKAKDDPNSSQICRLTNVINYRDIINITWNEPTSDAGTQPTNPVKFKEVFPAIASTISNVGSDSVPVYVNKGKPRSCNSSNLKAGKDDEGNVIKNTYAKKTEVSVPILADALEMGNIEMNPDSLIYNSSSSRARTPKDSPVSLMQGDKIFAKTGWQFYVAYSADGNAPYTVSGWLNSFIAPSNIKLHLLIRLSPEATAEKNVLTSGIFTSATSSELSVSQINPIHDGDIRKSSFTETLDGNGLTPVVSTFYARPNTTICVALDKVDWHVTGIEADKYKFVIRYRNTDNTLSNIIGLEDPNLLDNIYFIKVPSDAVSMQIFIRMDVGQSLTYSVYPAPDKSDNLDSRLSIVKAVNHRGYNTIAPENTLPAFRLSAKMGFGYVETDIQKTADGELVCIHDYTVDRTSNGTGKVADMTLEQLKALDFGSWKSADYAGTKIPTLAEFLVCCRNLGLHAYLELKIGGIAQQLVQMVEAYGMKNHVTYIGFNEVIMETILSYDPKARIGLIRNNVTADDITWVNNHKTTENEVFIDAVYANIKNAVALCKSANIALEVWGIKRSGISEVDEYISGFTADNVNASIVKYGEELLK